MHEWPQEQANLHANKSFPLEYFLFFLGLRIEQYLILQNLQLITSQSETV